MAVARFESGNLPMSSADIASTTPTDSRLMSRLFCKEARMPVTTTSWSSDGSDAAGAGGASAGWAANRVPLRVIDPNTKPARAGL